MAEQGSLALASLSSDVLFGQSHQIRWVHHPEGILKVNVDGVSKLNNGLAGVGCVVQDSQGH